MFNIDIEWIEENFSTREPKSYKRLFKNNIEHQYIITHPIFPVPIGNTK